jgi:hypothetical protein
MIYVPPTMMERLPRTGKGFVRQEHYEVFRQLLYDIVAPQQPMTVRQVFYQAVVRGYVNKTDKGPGNGYGFVQRDLVIMRRNGMIPYEWIVDESRRMRSPAVWDSLEEYIEEIPDGYRRNLLVDYDFSIQVWLEKEALIGVVEPITDKWCVPLCPAKGYSSLSFLHSAGRELERLGKQIIILYLGDYDPSGQDALATVERDLPEHAPNAAALGFDFRVLAVTPEQIEELALPTRPTKTTDTRAESFGSDESVELDAIEPNVLRQILDDALATCFPPDALERNEEQEEADQDELGQLLERGRR